MAERDYILGTHDPEIARLGLQHRVWRPYALEAWRRAGIRSGSRVVDFGAGPGFATLDLAEIVGPDGEVVALERSRRFLDVLEERANKANETNVRAIEIDLSSGDAPPLDADAAWCRWIFAFLPEPKAALATLRRLLRDGGALVIHEYLDYGAWRLAPRSAPFERFVGEVMASWRAAGGEPDVGLDLPRWLEEEGFAIRAQKQIVEFVTPADYMWGWPASFTAINLERMVELGRLTRDEASEIARAFAESEATPGARMVTPIVLEIIASKV